MATKKKVDTFIDQKETFVSLRKSFADSGSVEEKLKTLYELQQADNAIDKLVQLRGELPLDVQTLENEIAQLEDAKNALSAEINGYNEGIKEQKRTKEDLAVEMAKYQEQLSNITNSREYDSINKEIENITQLDAIADKIIGGNKRNIESKQEEIDKLDRAIELKQADLDEKKVELDGIVESTAEEEKKLQVTRDACAAKIDERTLSAYNRIRESVSNHQAVVSVYNDSCGGCFNAVTPQRLIEISNGNKLIICEHCGRILVNIKSEEAK